MIITVDGPTASGKTTLARNIAQSKKFFHLSSGFLYRAICYLAHQNNINLDDENKIYSLIEKAHIRYENTPLYTPVIFINNIDVTTQIQTEKIGVYASRISIHKKIREYINHIQKLIATQKKNLVADGRDSGTHVFPNAEVKIFLTASINERAKRMCQRNAQLTLEKCTEYIAERDQKDKERIYGKLYAASDAHIIDNTKMSKEQTLQEALSFLNKHSSK